MVIGSVKEIKTHEYRVGMTPSCVQAYTRHGHKVLFQEGAGVNAGFDDSEYVQAGAQIVGTAKEVFDGADMIVKVKEPQPSEYDLFKPGQILYTYLHLAANQELTQAMLDRKIRGVAYETMEKPDGQLPCLKPMSEIAGRLSVQEGESFWKNPSAAGACFLAAYPGCSAEK